MKKKRLLFLLPLIASFALTSCDLSSLLPNGPIRRSSKEEENSEVDNSINNRSSSNYSSSKSSYHKHAWGEWYVVVQPTCTEYGIDERMCAECGAIQQAQRAPRGHTWGEWTDYISATCTEDGLRMHRCSVCGYEEMEQYPAYGHEYDENQIVWSQEPSCERDGVGQATCLRCGSLETIKIPAYGHEMYLIGGEAQPTGDKAPVRVYSCSRCGITYLGFRCTDVTSESKTHLVYEDNQYGETGARFWGRPIGNDLPLDESGISINQTDGECVYDKDQTGDFFEFVFDLNQAQADALSDCYLYCDAKAADWLNGTDFWAYGSSHAEWTPGYYIDDNPDHYNQDGTGKRIYDYRYALYVDDQFQDFDSSIKAPTHGSNTNMTREEFIMPYRFHLHAGTNKIRLHMAGGYRSTFYNFIFRPVTENSGEEERPQTPVQPVSKDVVFEWKYQDIEPCLTDSGFSAPKEWEDGTKGVKFNRTDGGFTLDYIYDKRETLTFELLLAVKYSNKDKTGFWKQSSAEKTIIEFNGEKVQPPENDLDFSNVEKSTINDSGALSIPEWFSLTDLTLLQGENTISMRYLGTGYSYYVCGARLVRVTY